MIIESKRLKIGPWSLEDSQQFFELSQDEGFNLYPINVYRQATLESAREWLKKTREINLQTSLGKWGVWDKESMILIGMGGLTPWTWEGEDLVDITYRLRESAWGKGLGKELALALLNFARERGLINVTATITPDNENSKKIAENLGMTYDRRIILLNTVTDLYRLSGAK